MSTSEKVSFSKFGKTFQEQLAFLILDDRVFSDRMMEVLSVEFFELKHLQIFVEKVFQYKRKYANHPSISMMETILKSDLENHNEVSQKLVRDYFARIRANFTLDNSAGFVKDKAIDFCRKQKMREAMLKATGLLQRCSFDEISVVLNDALKAGADADFGYDYIKDFEKRFEVSGRETITTGWAKVDQLTGGGGRSRRTRCCYSTDRMWQEYGACPPWSSRIKIRNDCSSLHFGTKRYSYCVTL